MQGGIEVTGGFLFHGCNVVVFFRRKLSKLGFDLHFCIMTSVWDFSNPPFYWMITTENDVWGNKRKSRFRLDEPDSREK